MSWLHLTAAAGFVAILWFPRAIDLALPLPFGAAISLALLFLPGILMPNRRGLAVRSFWGLGATVLLSAIATTLWRYNSAASITPFLAFLTFVPVCLFFAGQLADSGVLGAVVRLNLGTAICVVVPLALYEALSANPLLAPSLIHEPPFVRATVGLYHPIILGVLLSLTICSVPLISSPAVRLLATFWLAAGVLASYSQGPFAATLLAAVIAWSRSARLWASRFAVLLAIGSATGLAAVVSQSSVDHIAGPSVSEYSGNYRLVLLRQIPRIINLEFFGYGLANAPQGVFNAYSDLLGSVDLAKTFDSELALWVLRFGAVGLVAYFLLFVRATRGLRQDAWLSCGMLLVLLVNGVTVALHSWVNVALMMAILIGQALIRSVDAAADGRLPSRERPA